jgi:hypothetical protein
MWGNDCDYERTLLDANHYHETSCYEAKKNQQDPKQGKYNHYHETSSYEAKKVQQDPKQGKYKVLNHGYLTPKILSNQIWVYCYYWQPLTYPDFTIFISDFLCISLKS